MAIEGPGAGFQFGELTKLTECRRCRAGLIASGDGLIVSVGKPRFNRNSAPRSPRKNPDTGSPRYIPPREATAEANNRAAKARQKRYPLAGPIR
jgi:hypothetical protein